MAGSQAGADEVATETKPCLRVDAVYQYIYMYSYVYVDIQVCINLCIYI